MTADLGNEKRALRAELRQRRRTRTTTERDTDTTALTSTLQRFVEERQLRSLALYLSAPDEPDVRPFLRWAQEHGVRVLLPITREDGLLDWAVDDGVSEHEGLHGMPEVVGEVLSPLALGDVDAILTPAAAVGHDGCRMGWGRGYYDKTLGSMANRPPVYAVIFDAEYLDEVPREAHDEPVDGIITPSRIITFRS
ncbi:MULTISPECIES: 5-formyltetrahydrofolate cyclo-ligase [unclassified Curtobacterium]|jgi:5-formyltetrahydrofolate cyclo-ligase|uniref:5-formyltetrahydrofolate cyclo-ligase n=1 Tax=unclassified Curtobacterium TaxID=257496 RepID=UPI00052AFBFD|nr:MULTISPECIES: 5-formyltetrahydrofolate cyclo-ligase [unclassified Curtobacterium]AIV40904.1 5-formyltetrahydrofolate cyclo-ligase [Curtobacterium sp. MR_MD2014]MBP1302683.1 5-formyltetrahydrofolate cyclo-ligase [Curtobacterium sp. 1310]MCM3506583.1 5-formyltetrahydrofolate cyclo-ligase [Curtobacterium sp. ODYSSEY 48 V2]MCM3522813.1 5-formyltetrahydrofolate cyclo-ligase [Curtobacterium sp. P97]MDB6426625.1 5-formyltetrahydrofolate cyclo-ligase [Curtobacterium sp. 20TX0008]